MECAPAFDYARAPHHTSIVDDHSIPCGGNDGAPKQQKALFESDLLSLDLRFVAESTVENVPVPDVELQLLDLTKRGHKGPAISVDLALEEGQAVTFILRTAPETNGNEAKLRPSEARAQALGVPLESRFAVLRDFNNTISECSITCLYRVDNRCFIPQGKGRSLINQGLICLHASVLQSLIN